MAANMRLQFGDKSLELPFSESEYWSVVRPFDHENEKAQENLDYASRNYGNTFNAGLMIGLLLGRRVADLVPLSERVARLEEAWLTAATALHEIQKQPSDEEE